MKCPICDEEVKSKQDFSMHLYLNEDNTFHDNIELLSNLLWKDQDKKYVMMCPYCGSKNVIPDSVQVNYICMRCATIFHFHYKKDTFGITRLTANQGCKQEKEDEK